MRKVLVELKARIYDLDKIRQVLLRLGAEYVKTLRQKDVYFDNVIGRFKLRVNSDGSAKLVYYKRPNEKYAKESIIYLIDIDEPDVISRVLSETLGIKVVVEKVREIYRWQDVRVHLDQVEGLGVFLEFEYEVIDHEEVIRDSKNKLMKMLRDLGINEEQLQEYSYSDMLLKR